MPYLWTALLFLASLYLTESCVRVKQTTDRKMYHKVRCETLRGCYVEMGMEWRARRSTTSDVIGPLVIPSDEISRLCDGNGDNFLEEIEYRTCFTVPAYMSEQTFKEFDKNSDGKLGEAEATSLKIILTGGADCYKTTIKRCTLQALLTLRATLNIYNASQEYTTCLAAPECHDSDLEAYIFVVKRFIDDLSNSGEFCGHLGSDNNSTIARCSQASICHCGDLMVIDLKQGVDPCDVISSFRECVQDYTFGCEDALSYHARSGAEAMVQVYSQMGLCRGVTI